MSSSPRSKFSDLPVDILQIICKKISFIKDFVVFGAVCTPWRSVLFQCRQKIPPQLMLGQNHSQIPIFCYPDLSKQVLSTTKEGSYSYCGSSHGWLIIKRKDDTLQLLNPFSSVNNLIQLPSPKTLPLKVVLSHDPLKTSDYVVVMSDDKYKLFFFKAGDTSWTPVRYFTEVVAFTYYRDCIFAMDCFGSLLSCDINSTPLSLKKVASTDHSHIGYDSHLLELAGDLLYVKVQYSLERRNIECQVFKVVFKVEPRETFELNNLRGHAIFLTYKSSVVVLASDFPNCKPNHIYFSKQGFSGSFNVIDKSYNDSYQLPEFYSTPVWIQPTLNMIKRDDHQN